MDATPPILVVGGFGSNWQTYIPLQKALAAITRRRVDIAPIAMFDWLAVIASNEYSSLLGILDRAVHASLHAAGADRLTLVAHSAGGVLARIYMGDQPYGKRRLVFNGFQRVATFVSLGTPHRTMRCGRAGGLDQITFVQDHYPEAYWRFIRYVTVMGKSVFGIENGPPIQRGAWQSYQMISGTGCQWGDGVVPLECGLLEGAHHVVLASIRHDPRPDRPWYGHNEEVVRTWWRTVEQVERGPTR